MAGGNCGFCYFPCKCHLGVLSYSFSVLPLVALQVRRARNTTPLMLGISVLLCWVCLGLRTYLIFEKCSSSLLEMLDLDT